jgi:creatinine amidohydrolase
VLVAPALNFGSSPYFLAYPGTLSFRLTTLMDAGEDLVRSAYQQGFRRLLVLNGHGGNSGLRARLVEIIGGMPGLKMQWFEWWQAHSVEATAMAHGLKPAHANWLEAFPFTRVSELPEDEKLPPSVPSSILDPDSARQIYGDGNFGGPYVAANEIMEAVFSAALQDVLELLKFGEG